MKGIPVRPGNYEAAISAVLHQLQEGIAGVGEIRSHSVRRISDGLYRTGVLTDLGATASKWIEKDGFDHQPSSSGTGGGDGAGVPPPEPSAADAPELVMRELGRMVREGDAARWANFDPRLYHEHKRSFETWLQIEGPLAPLNSWYGLNCWEMVCYAAGRAGVLDKHVLRDLLTPPRKSDGSFDQAVLDAWLVRTGDRLIPGERTAYTGETDTPRPQYGDIVMWNRCADHVAVATGRTGPDRSPEIYSFWPPPKDELVPDPETGSYSRVTDAIQVTTVDVISAAATGAGLGQQFDIVFGRGPW